MRCVRSATLEEDLRALLVAGAINQIVAALSPHLLALAKDEAATTGEMQAKFSQDVKGMLEYNSLDAFYGGLEKLVGPPNPVVAARPTSLDLRLDVIGADGAKAIAAALVEGRSVPIKYRSS